MSRKSSHGAYVLSGGAGLGDPDRHAARAVLGTRNRVEVVIAAYEWGLIAPGHTPHSAT